MLNLLRMRERLRENGFLPSPDAPGDCCGASVVSRARARPMVPCPEDYWASDAGKCAKLSAELRFATQPAPGGGRDWQEATGEMR
jgi:hypothetical protein